MKKKFYLSILLAPFMFLASCNESENGKGQSFTTDFENLAGWVDNPAIIKCDAHSGKWASVANKLKPYSHTFKIKLRDVGDKTLQKVNVSAWCYVGDLPCDAKLVTAINSPEKENAMWEGKPLTSIIREKGKWMQINASYRLNRGGLNNPDNTLLVYVWNLSDANVLVDDISVSFE
jgi:hypothetical protein